MNGLGINLKCRRQLRAACASLVLIAGVVSLSACGGGSTGYDYETASHHDPAVLEALKGKDVQRVTIDAEGVERAGIQTAPIRQNGQGTVMPHSAVIYDADGEIFTYTSPEPRTYVRQKIVIDDVVGDSVMLSDGPPAGTEVVTVGAAFVYGSEFEVAH
jgi:hypothetical protein